MFQTLFLLLGVFGLLYSFLKLPEQNFFFNLIHFNSLKSFFSDFEENPSLLYGISYLLKIKVMIKISFWTYDNTIILFLAVAAIKYFYKCVS